MAEIFFNKTSTVLFLKKALAELHKNDKRAENYKAVFGTIGGILGTLAFLSICGFFASLEGNSFAETLSRPFGLISFVVLVGGGAIAILCAFIWGHFNKFDIEDRRLSIAREFIQKLTNDFKEKKTLQLYIDFRDYLKYAKLMKTMEGKDKVTKYKNYLEFWFLIRGAFKDGNKFKISIANSVTRKEKAKNKGTKVTEKVKEKIIYIIKVNPQMYPHYQQAPQYLPAGKNFLGMVLRNARVSGRKLKLEFNPDGNYKKITYNGTNEYGKPQLTNEVKLIKGLLLAYSALKKCR